jgi:type II secretion system protein N
VTPGRVRRIVLAAAVFAASLAALFPTDALVRRALGRPGWPPIVFGSAHLRPGGIRLDDVRIVDTAGHAWLHAESLRLRPSLASLVAGRGGLPLTIDGTVCNGVVRATVAGEGAGTAVTVAWREADLGRCPPLAIAGGALAGRAAGTARLRLAPGAPPAGDGDLVMEDAAWAGQGFAALLALRAATASLVWRLADGRLDLDDVALTAPELVAGGRGTVTLAEPVAASALALELVLEPSGGALGALLRGRGPHQVTVGGTLERPRVVVQ